MQTFALACAGLAILQGAIANPIASLGRRALLSTSDDLPSSNEVLEVISGAQEIAISISDSSDIIANVNAAFDDIYSIVQIDSSELDGASIPTTTTIIPIIDSVICQLLLCDRSVVLSPGSGVVDPEQEFLPSELAIAELQGWANGTIPIPSEVADVSLDADTVTQFVDAVSGMVKIWKKASGSTPSPQQKRALRQIAAAKMHKRVAPLLIGAVIGLAVLLWSTEAR
ncbi:hypothetical protein LTR84_004530 [Exophiala bonariae]|uniref:Uncharacterized protein n=1 Tax=Exophiala bonariae TaxID=1690606 RepID=A0AAV9NPW6_9EURO|nr:hypothetical protein LTR84_004530 [Exophiala bonariae]